MRISPAATSASSVDDEAVECAEPFAVIRARVMKAAHERRRNYRRAKPAAPPRDSRRSVRHTDGNSSGDHGNFCDLRERARLAGLDRGDVFRRMHAPQILFRHRRGLCEPHVRGIARSPSATSANFRIGMSVLADRCGEAGMVKRGQHCVGGSSASTAASSAGKGGESRADRMREVLRAKLRRINAV